MNTAGTPERASSDVTVRDVVRAVIADVAPEELPVVDALRQFDDETAVSRLGRGGARREPLGFGLEDAVYLVTPVLWIALDQSVRKTADRAVDGFPHSVRRLFRRASRRRPEPLAVPELTVHQVADIRQRVLELAATSGLSPERAEALADHLAVRLLIPVTPVEDERPAAAE
ncbi:hypothetical protein [Micromonospora carbonacea]|uniref:hypothetical protein n=1 Tax=Micromonospora carbonacea TaxID=47853 RepID=UPI003D718C64